MSVERIHPLEALATSFTLVRPIVEVKLFVPLAVMGSCEALPTSGPFTLVRLFLIM